MARRYYRRRTVTVRPKKKWATNINTRNYTIDNTGSSGTSAVPYIGLVTNSSQSSSPTPVVLKAGNFKVNADVNYTVSSTATNVHLVAFVLFLPEGNLPINNQQFGNIINAHPEYILAWRQLDAEYVSAAGGTVKNVQRVTFSSRLKRNLNSGDSVVFGILDQSTSLIPSITVQLTCQYWTCAN